jgi:hypothetical protein
VKNLTPIQQAFIDARIAQAKNEIVNAMFYRRPFYQGGKVPPLSINTFGSLHDYCDANCLGGLCDDDIVDEGNALFARRTDQDTVMSQEWMEVCNDIQTAVHVWIANGTMTQTVNVMRHLLNPEQTKCLLDQERNDEAVDMMDDLEGRVGEAFGFTKPACDLLRTLLQPKTEGLVSSDAVVKECSAKALTAIRTARDELCEAMKAAPPVTSMLLLHFIEEAAQLANALEQFDAAIRE